MIPHPYFFTFDDFSWSGGPGIPGHLSCQNDVFQSTNNLAAFQTLGGALGNVPSGNYTYYVSIESKFSFLVRAPLQAEYDQLRQEYLWPMSRMDTNVAYQAATPFLAAASMDVEA